MNKSCWHVAALTCVRECCVVKCIRGSLLKVQLFICRNACMFRWLVHLFSTPLLNFLDVAHYGRQFALSRRGGDSQSLVSH